MMRVDMTLAPMILKIEAHISMIPQEVIMAINNKFEVVLNVFLDNYFYILEKTVGQK